MQNLGYKPSALAIELCSTKAIARKELSLSNWSIASLYISLLCLTSHLRSTVVLLENRTPGTGREIYSKDVDDETSARDPGLQSQCSSH